MLEAAVFSTGCMRGKRFRGALQEWRNQPFLLARSSQLQMCVTGAGCVPVSERICYRGCRCNRGHGVVSSSGNTNLQDDL